jgi:hypothetical protein
MWARSLIPDPKRQEARRDRLRRLTQDARRVARLQSDPHRRQIIRTLADEFERRNTRDASGTPQD